MVSIDNLKSKGKITVSKTNYGIEYTHHSFFSKRLLAKLFFKFSSVKLKYLFNVFKQILKNNLLLVFYNFWNLLLSKF